MFATIGHTFELMKMSWNVLMMDRELILFPIMSGMGLLVLAFAGLAVGVAESGNLIAFLVMILMAYFITTFFNAALISARSKDSAVATRTSCPELATHRNTSITSSFGPSSPQLSEPFSGCFDPRPTTSSFG